MINRVRNPEENTSSVYSLGTAAAIEGLERLLKLNVNNTPNVLCVNIGTLVRNFIAYAGDLSPTNLEIRIRAEISALCQDAKGLMTFAGVEVPVVYLYWHGYKQAVPEILVRKDSKSRASVNNKLSLLLNRRQTLLSDMDEAALNVAMSVTSSKDTKLPHTKIINDVRKLSNQPNALMISHYPLDYHAINSRFIKLRILESYTGEIGPKDRMNEKIFGHKDIPFCGILHQLLGDKKGQLKSPLSRKETKLIKDTAISNKWSLFPISEIKSKVKDLGFKPYINID